jgi:hypothetical protein
LESIVFVFHECIRREKHALDRLLNVALHGELLRVRGRRRRKKSERKKEEEKENGCGSKSKKWQWKEVRSGVGQKETY